MDNGRRSTVSVAFFSPQSNAPDAEYLSGLRQVLRQNIHGRRLLASTDQLEHSLDVFTECKEEIGSLPDARYHARLLHDWASGGSSVSLSNARSGIVALPLLMILHIGQYFQYLQQHNMSHAQFINDVKTAGGLQGYCGGLPSAMAIACAKDEDEICDYAVAALRILVGIGAYSEIAEDKRHPGPTTLAIRVKYEGQGEDIVQKFPKTYVSAITEPRSISVVGPAVQLAKLRDYARAQGLSVHEMDIRGKVHNPENTDLAQELSDVCRRTDYLKFPNAARLRVPVRSNVTGQALKTESLADEMIHTVLASKCNWFDLIGHVADDLKETGRPEHSLLLFGLVDCVPTTPLRKHGLRAVKIEARHGIKPLSDACVQRIQVHGSTTFPDDTVAIVGASCRLPGANNLEELWSLLSNGSDLHEEVSQKRFDLSENFRASQGGRCHESDKFFGNFIDNIERFDNSFFGISPREAANMDPQQRLLLELSVEALEASGYLSSHHRESGDNVGCFIGASLVEYTENTNSYPATAYTSTGTFRAFLSGRISYNYGWSGPSEVVDTACSSSLVAINRACKSIQAGECSMALAGGVNLITGMDNYLELKKAGFLSPTGQCKPFDARADGYCRSDGGGLVVLKRLGQAVADGDSIMAVLRGIATNQGGLSPTITTPQASSQMALYRKVLEQANMTTSDVSYVEAHGTGTQVGDPIELEGLRTVFGNRSRSSKLHIGSIKANIGHCETAAGVAGLLKVLAMMQHGQIPKQPNFERLNPKVAPLEPDGITIPGALCSWTAPLRTAIVSSYGAAGSNCALICCEMPQTSEDLARQSRSDTSVSYPIYISAKTRTSLLSSVTTLADHLRRRTDSFRLGDIALTLDTRRARHKHFFATAVTSTDELIRKLEIPDTMIHECPKEQNPVVLTFSGQTSKIVSLDKEVYDAFSVFRAHLDSVDHEVKKLGHSSIYPFVFQKQPIQDVVVLQSSIFAVQYACARSWIDAGLRPSALIGHSIGELSALVIAGVLSLSDGVKLVASRAHLIATKWGAEKGAMLAINVTAEKAGQLIADVYNRTSLKVEIACFNAESSMVLAGTSAAIDAAESILRTESQYQEFKHRRLETSHGFHNALVETILPELTDVARGLRWNEPQIHLETCTEGHWTSFQTYSVSEHARQPVFFDHAIRRLADRLGPCIWMEAGFNTPIVRMIKKAIRNPMTNAFQEAATSTANGSVSSISEVVIKMWCYGLSVCHWNLMSTQQSLFEPVWLPPYQFEKPPHWLKLIDRVTAAQKLLVDANRPPEASVAAPARLVTRVMKPGLRDGESAFTVNTHSERFQKIVSGHAVRLRPLCPASMYMECVVSALHLLEVQIQNVNLGFEDVNFQSPLNAGKETEVTIELSQRPNGQSWNFTVATCRSTKASVQSTVHAKGTVMLPHDLGLNPFQRLVTSSMTQLDSRNDVDRLSLRRAYGVFASVVQYESFYQGMNSIVLGDCEASATIKIPQHQPSRHESPAWKVCDTVVLDSFIQVLGLLLNSSDMVNQDEVMIASGIERTLVASTCNMEGSDSWRVYAKYPRTQDTTVLGDVFAFSSQGKPVVALLGCCFKKLQIAKLERALDSPRSMVKRPAPSADMISTSSAQPTPYTISTAAATHSAVPTRQLSLAPLHTNLDPINAYEIQATEGTLLELLIAHTGLSRSEIPLDATLNDLGLDSLATTELTNDLQVRLDLTLNHEELFHSSINDLKKRLSGRTWSEPPAKTPSGELYEETPALTQRNHAHDTETVNKVDEKCRRLLQVLSEASSIPVSEIKHDHSLGEMGIDSLTMMDLKQQLEEDFHADSRGDSPELDTTVRQLMDSIGVSTPNTVTTLSKGETNVRADKSNKFDSQVRNHKPKLPSPVEILISTECNFEKAADRNKLTNYWTRVSPLQDKLLIAYITEAMAAQGIDLSAITEGEPIPEFHHIPKHRRVVERLLGILEGHKILMRLSGSLVRGPNDIDHRKAAELLALCKSSFPQHGCEFDLMGFTGLKLAAYLCGQADPIAMVFDSAVSSKLIADFYSLSPPMSTLTDQLIVYLTQYAQQSGATHNTPLRILEIGAGTSGITSRLVKALAMTKTPIIYTLTDTSPNFVSKAKVKFSQYSWMRYSTFDLEKDIPQSFSGAFDVVISAHYIHATTSLVASCSRIYKTLSEDGILLLCELVRPVDWYDMCFGLLAGWWLARDGSAHPTRSATTWMSTFKEAGFGTVDYSRGETMEAQTQSLLLGCKRQWSHSRDARISTIRGSEFTLETMVYKEVGGVKIHADIYLPSSNHTGPFALAIMVHGGGFMSLSRKAVRPHQTRYLVSQGFLPVSIDYRLCPEIDIVKGPMVDTLDAYLWTRNVLPRQLAARGVNVDSTKIVVIGWSSGGQLAMSIGWSARQAGLPPPTAVLSFYGPVDFESGELDQQRLEAMPGRQMSMDSIIAALPRTPVSTAAIIHGLSTTADTQVTQITNYEASRSDSTNLGWIQPGDPRSELLLSLFKEGNGLALMLNGLPSEESSNSLSWTVPPPPPPPPPEAVAAISPMSQVLAGNYTVPTYVIHGTEDEIVPFAAAQRFVDRLKERGVKSGLLKVVGGKHIHDLTLKPGTKTWETEVQPGYDFLFDCVNDHKG